MKKKFKAFSISEIAIVVLVILVLSGIVVNTSSRSRDKANYATAEETLDAITKSVTTAYAIQGKFGSVTEGPIQNAFTGDFRDEVETNIATNLDNLADPWGNSYQISGTNLSDIDNGTGADVELHAYVLESTGTGKRTNSYKYNASGTPGVEMDRVIFRK